MCASGAQKKGFSLIEAAIVLGVVGVVIGVIWVAATAVMKKKRISDGSADAPRADPERVNFALNYALDPSNMSGKTPLSREDQSRISSGHDGPLTGQALALRRTTPGFCWGSTRRYYSGSYP